MSEERSSTSFVGKRFTVGHTLVVVIITFFSLICLYPFLLTISGSLTTQADVIKYGFRLIPKSISTKAYDYLLTNKEAIVGSYKITIFTTVVGSTISLTCNSMIGFVLSRQNLKFRKGMNFYVLFPMLFSGGMVPWYIICVNVFHLKNNILALIMPMLVSPWNIFLFRNYFTSIPEAMYESAKIDGAGDFLIFRAIYIKLATPVLATVALFTGLGYWNDWWLGMILIDTKELRPLQLLLRNIVSNLQFLKSADAAGMGGSQVRDMLSEIPNDSVKMAMVLVTTGPILLLYPFVQRYFVKGIMVGAVKG